MSYPWIEDLKPYVSQIKIDELCELVDKKIKRGLTKKWLYIMNDFFLIVLIFVVVVNFLPTKGIDTRVSVINGLIAFELAIFTFIGPIKTSSITPEEVDNILGTAVTTEIMAKIHKSVTKNTSGTNRWFAVIGACGLVITMIAKNCI